MEKRSHAVCYSALNTVSTATDWEVLESCDRRRKKGKDIYIAEGIWAERKVSLFGFTLKEIEHLLSYDGVLFYIYQVTSIYKAC